MSTEVDIVDDADEDGTAAIRTEIHRVQTLINQHKAWRNETDGKLAASMIAAGMCYEASSRMAGRG